MTRAYTHLELNQEIPAPSGRYILDRELKLDYGGRSVLAVVGSSIVDSSCCGAASWRYAIVPGFILKWQSRRDSSGRPLTEVEPVTDDDARRQIAGSLKTSEAVSTVEFW